MNTGEGSGTDDWQEGTEESFAVKNGDVKVFANIYINQKVQKLISYNSNVIGQVQKSMPFTVSTVLH